MTAAHTELIAGVDWEIGVIRQSCVPIGAIGIIAVGSCCTNDRQCCQNLEIILDSQVQGEHGGAGFDGSEDARDEGKECIVQGIRKNCEAIAVGRGARRISSILADEVGN